MIFLKKNLIFMLVCLDFLFHIFSGYEHFIQNAKFDREKFKKSKSNEIKKVILKKFLFFYFSFSF